MDSKTRRKWEVRLAALILFVAGFIAGGLAMNLYRSREWSPRSGDRGSFEHMLDRLNLTQDQRTEVSTIFEDARRQLNELRKESEPKFKEVRKNTDDRLQAVLTKEQWEQFQRMTHKGGRRFGPPRREEGPH
jgi:Spy/CpxP family protein refolding chaperone